MARALLLLTLGLTAAGCRTLATPTWKEWQEDRELAGVRHQFPSPDGKGRVSELRDPPDPQDCQRTVAAGIVARCVVGEAPRALTLDGFREGDFAAVEFFTTGSEGRVASIRAYPRYPPEASTLEAQLAFLERASDQRIDSNGLLGFGREGDAGTSVVVLGKDWTRTWLGVEEGPAGRTVRWIAKRKDGTGKELLEGLQFTKVPQPGYDREQDLRKLGLTALTRLLPALEPILWTEEGKAYAKDVQAALREPLDDPRRRRERTREGTSMLHYLARELEGLSEYAKAGLLTAEERAITAKALPEVFARAFPPALTTRLQAPVAGFAAEVETADADRLRALGQEVRRFEAVLDLTGPSKRSEVARALERVDALSDPTTYERGPPGARAVERELIAGFLTRAAMRAAERGQVVAALRLRLGAQRLEGRLPPKPLALAGAGVDPGMTPAQRELRALLLGMVGGPPREGPLASLFTKAVAARLSAPLRAAHLAFSHDDPFWFSPQSTAKPLTLSVTEIGNSIAETTQEVKRSHYETRTVTVSNDAALVQHQQRLAAQFAELERIDLERARVWSDMPMAVDDDDVVLDRVTGMAIGPNTGPGKYLKEKRATQQGRLAALDSAERWAIAEINRLQQNVPDAQRTQQVEQRVTRIEKLPTFDGHVFRQHRLTDGEKTFTATQLAAVEKVKRDGKKTRADLIKEIAPRFEQGQADEVRSLAADYLDAKAKTHLEDNRRARNWTPEELAEERMAVRWLFSLDRY